MNTTPFRQLDNTERRVIQALLVPYFPGRDALSQQLEDSLVRLIDQDGSLEFQVRSPIRATEVKYAVPTEATYVDSDGVTVHLLLHVVDDQLKELEIYKEDGSKPIRLPDPSELRVSLAD
jgi:hypothetical protein